MSSIYNIDFSLVAERVSPPAKRTITLVKWLKSLMAPLQWLRDMMLGNYANGIPQDVAPFYDFEATYNYGNLVVDGNDKVYQNIYSAGTTTNQPPTDTAYWLPVLDTYIGLRERMVYNSQTIVLNAILNKKFRVPDDISPIYIDNEDNDLDSFYFYKRLEGYPGIFFQNSTEDPAEPVYMYKEGEYISEYDYVVMVPEELQGLYPPASPSVTIEELLKMVEEETARYNVLGMKFIAEYY